MPLNARPYRITHKKTEDKTENELDPREMYLLTANTRQRKAKANRMSIIITTVLAASSRRIPHKIKVTGENSRKDDNVISRQEIKQITMRMTPTTSIKNFNN